VSTPEQISFATTYEASAMTPLVVSGQLVASLCDLMRLNMDTCRFVFSGAALHWESVLQAQTPEQVVRHQADAMPWLAMQIAGYMRGCMDIASRASANLVRATSDRHDDHERHVDGTLGGTAQCALSGISGVCHRHARYRSCVPPAAAGGDPGVTEEADVDPSWLGTAVGALVLAIAAAGGIAHYRREQRRADLLRNLDHHEWWYWRGPRR
jgi:hypothetical protein